MVECPRCDRTFDNQHGLRIHHAHIHSESLPNCTCADCGAEFHDPKARQSYCDACDPNAGQNNGNWKGALEQAACKRCGDTFQYYPSNKKGVYCPYCVETATEFLGDPHNPDAERVDTECDHCGDRMSPLRSRLENGNGRFCSRDCLGSWLSENVVGESHHQYENDDVVYCGRWWRVRRNALERDDHECQRCGKGKEALGTEPDVHHVRPIRSYDDPQEAHRLSNVISLCRSCHRLVESGSAEKPEQ